MCAMYSNPAIYERANALQIRDAKELFDRIERDQKKHNFTIRTALDIGCGTGNITEMFFDRFKPRRLVAFDLSQDMVDFANAHHMREETIQPPEADQIPRCLKTWKHPFSDDCRKGCPMYGSTSKAGTSTGWSHRPTRAEALAEVARFKPDMSMIRAFLNEDMLVVTRKKPVEHQQVNVVIDKEKPVERQQVNVVIDEEKPVEHQQANVVIDEEKPVEHQQVNVVIDKEKPVEHQQANVVIDEEKPIEPQKVNVGTIRKNAIEYHQGDACQEFPALSKKLGLGEACVDVAFSVYCLHWVPEKRKAIANMARFLRPGGRFYLLISTWSDFFPRQHAILNSTKWRDSLLRGLALAADSERPQLRENDVPANPDSNTDAEAQAQGAQRRFSNLDMVRRPSEEFLYQLWARTFLAETLDMERIDFTFAYFPVKKEKDFLEQCHAVCYWLNYLPKEQHMDFLEDYFQLIKDFYIKDQVDKHAGVLKTLKGEPPKEKDEGPFKKLVNPKPNDDELFRFHYNYATMIGERPCRYDGEYILRSLRTIP